MTEGSENCQHTSSIVLNQLQDVMKTQKLLLDKCHSEMQTVKSTVTSDRISNEKLKQELEDERFEHARTKALLAHKSDRLQFALGEIEILTNQLTREKALFEASFGKISERAKEQSAKSHTLEVQCTTIKAEKEKQEEVLAFKDAKITDLKMRLASQKENHRRRLEDVELQMQQEAYISRNLATARGKGRSKSGISQR